MTLVIGRYSGCDWRVFRRDGSVFYDDRGKCLAPSDWHDATEDEQEAMTNPPQYGYGS